MKLTLTDFEQQIDPAILKRGRQYYKKGHVAAFDEISHNEYEALVEGTETYTVRLGIRDGVVSEALCDCPYDMGPVCKHEVAALYHAAYEFFAEPQDEPLPPRKRGRPAARKEPGAPPKPKRKTVAEQMREALDGASHEQLRHFVARLCDRDRAARVLFLSQFADREAPATKELYAERIRALAGVAAGRDGYIGYSAARGFARSVGEFLENARGAMAEGDVRKAANISRAVVEETARALEMADDGGAIGDCADTAMALLSEIAQGPLDEPFRGELLDHFAGEYGNALLRSWDWHWEMMRLAIRLVRTPQEEERLAGMLSKVVSTNSEWAAGRAGSLMVELLGKTRGEEAAVRYMEEHLANRDFRERLIELAVSSAEWERAIELAREGISREEKQRSGLADRWREHLLAVYRKTGEGKNAAPLLRHLLTSPRSDGYMSEPHFRELKRLTPPEQWPQTLEGIIKEVNRGYTRDNYEALAALRIWEGQREELLELLQRNASLRRISAAEAHLRADCTPQLVELYRECILGSMEDSANVNRTHYREVCRCLRRMIKLGARTEAEALSAELRRLYPARRALMEELGNV